MKTATLLLFLGFAAGPPALVASEPASGARDVPPDAGVVRLRFDRDMDTAGFTLWASDRGRFPPLDEKRKARWIDARTFEVPIGPLEPGVDWAIQLNSEQRQGFAAATGEPLPVTVVAFRSASAAGPGIVNVADDFLAYHAAAVGRDAAGRAALWNTLLEARHPSFFSDAIYRGKRGTDRDAMKAACLRAFWEEIAPRIEEIRGRNDAIAGQIRDVLAAFKEALPDFRLETELYVTISFSFRGKVVGVGGKDVFAIGLDHFTEPGDIQTRVTIAHELFHLYHFRTFSAGGGLYRTLWAEGLATYASAAVVPGRRRSEYLGFPAEKMNRCAELLPKMAAELLANLGENDPRLRRVYFGAEENDAGIPPEAGYYVGLLAVEDLARETPLARLAALDPEEVYRRLAAELTRMSK